MGLRTHAKGFFFSVLKQIDFDLRIRRRLSVGDNTMVLNLHRISPEKNPFWSPLEPKVFDELLAYLSKSFALVSLSELDTVAKDRPAVVLSFDDGYGDFVEYAMPILAKYRVKANLNVIPNCVETGEPIWNVRLYDFLNAAPRSLINELHVDGFEEKLEGESLEEKARFGARLSRYLKMRPRKERETLWPSIEAVMARNASPKTSMMNLQQVQAASKEHDIGVHSYTHESMAFESDEFFLDDLKRCTSFFNEKLHLPLSIYAFPNGSYRSSQVKALLSAGIKRILLVDERRARRPARVFPRLTISGTGVNEVVFQSLGYRT